MRNMLAIWPSMGSDASSTILGMRALLEASEMTTDEKVREVIIEWLGKTFEPYQRIATAALLIDLDEAGLKVAPKEATDKMKWAALEAFQGATAFPTKDIGAKVWADMLAASDEP